VRDLLGTVVGGLLAIGGGLLVGLTSHLRERTRWKRNAQLRTSAELLTALQALMRRMLDLAFLADKRSNEEGRTAISRYHEATIDWNSAIYAALLVGPRSLALRVQGLDREVDRLLDGAMSKQWTRQEFRDERREIGRLAAEYVSAVRKLTGQPDIQLRSVWTWDQD
jgi:hypothetical protein